MKIREMVWLRPGWHTLRDEVGPDALSQRPSLLTITSSKRELSAEPSGLDHGRFLPLLLPCSHYV